MSHPGPSGAPKLQLVVWNSQGNKWSSMFNDWMQPRVKDGDTMLGLLVESGWAPFVKSGDVTINKPYACNNSMTYFESQCKDQEDQELVKAITDARGWDAMWVPWVGHLDAQKTNTRCSVGAIIMNGASIKVLAYQSMDRGLIRPVVRFGVGTTSAGPFLTVYLIHAVSCRALAALEACQVVDAVRKEVSESTAAVIVGDFNDSLIKYHIDKPGTWPKLRDGWRFLRCGKPTQSWVESLTTRCCMTPKTSSTR